MDCSQFEKIVHDLDRPGTEGFALRESALAHAESCSHCAPLMTDVGIARCRLARTGTREAGQQASPRVGVGVDRGIPAAEGRVIPP